jgi:hypothetical protein
MGILRITKEEKKIKVHFGKGQVKGTRYSRFDFVWTPSGFTPTIIINIVVNFILLLILIISLSSLVFP